MNIGFNTSALAVNQSGSAAYIRFLIDGLRRFANCKVSEFAYRPVFSRKYKLFRGADSFRREFLWLNKTLSELSDNSGIELLHFPEPYADPKFKKRPWVVTVHDLHPILHPEDFPVWHRKTFAWHARKCIPAATAVITVSEYTREQVLNMFPEISASQVIAIHHGIDAAYRNMDQEEIVRAKEKYALQRPYFMSIATWSRHKNLDVFLSAFSRVAEGIPYDLLLVGQAGWRSNAPEELVVKYGLEERVKHVGYLKQSELVALLSGAEALVFPSLYEGFGLPPLEAMACGTAVLASDRGSIPEVVGDAAILFDPTDAEELAMRMLELAKEKELRESLEEKGRRHVVGFTWEKAALQTKALYESLI